jgi:hypothetical protein
MSIFGLSRPDDMNRSKLKPDDEIQAGQNKTDLLAQPMSPLEASMTESLNARTAGTNGTDIEDDRVVPLSTRRSGRPSSRPQSTPTGSDCASISSQDDIRHNLIARRLMQLDDANARDFDYVYGIFRQQLQPVGVLEEILVERMAYEYLRKAASAKHYCDVARYVVNALGSGPGNLLKYDSMITRQFDKAMHELERLQRLRRGQNIPAPLNVHISHDITTASGDNPGN